MTPALAVLTVLVGLSVFGLLWAYLPALWGAPWVPSLPGTARKMLQMADVRPGQKVVDLGAGDGRIVRMAAREFEAEAVGVEIDPLRCLIANLWLRAQGLRNRARITYGNLYHFDVTGADVVTLYLLQPTNQALRERLGAQLRPGARVVSLSFSMAGWTPVALDDARGIFLYEIGRTGPEVQTRFV